MILRFNCVFGQILPLNLAERFGAAVELQALEFVNAIPIEWRLVSAQGTAITEWSQGIRYRRALAFHDLHVSTGWGTRGTSGAGLSIETRGIGDATLLVWLRDRTYEQANALATLRISKTESITK